MLFPELKTNRFQLLEIKPEDQAFIFRGLSHPQVIPYYGVSYGSFEETKGQMEFYERIWQEKTGCYWKIVDADNKEPLGVCGMNAYHPLHEKAELGFWLLPEHWGKGVMSEVMPIVIRHLFTYWKLYRLESVVETGNEASAKLSKRLGFTYEGTLREAEVKKGKRISLEVYSLLKPEFDHMGFNK